MNTRVILHRPPQRSHIGVAKARSRPGKVGFVPLLVALVAVQEAGSGTLHA